MKKTLFIHIGRPKVGSSAIQHFLWNNRSLLKDKGYLYPETGQLHKATHGLALVFLSTLPDARRFEGVSPESIYQSLVDETNNAGLDKVVVSSEMFYLLKNPGDIPCSLLEEFNVKVVCFIRRQDEVLLSSYVQEIKGNQLEIDCGFDEYLNNETRLGLLDYKKILDSWADVFGQENIIVRVFDKSKPLAAIFGDFLSAIGLNISDEFYLPPMRLNPSPPRDILEFIHKINQFPADDMVLRQLRAPLVRASEIIGNKGVYDYNTILGKVQRTRIMEIFAESNRETAETYLNQPSGDLFKMDDIDDMEQGNEYLGIEIDRFVQMVSALFVSQQNQIMNLLQGLNKAEGKLHMIEKELEENKREEARSWLNVLLKRK